MKKGGIGGAKTLTGLNFEKKVDFQNLLGAISGYEVKKMQGKAGKGVFFEGKLVARCFRKYDFYQYMIECKVDWKRLVSKRLLPDDALLVIVRETLFIIEVKYQQVAGSVDPPAPAVRLLGPNEDGAAQAGRLACTPGSTSSEP